ncbi:arylsulfatase [[Eubacterium] hominis]|uniref:arylsulfatase n=1 Tax=[Eubacterium] hominis TaxID=2764325 RepID=UPI003A4D9725
MKQKPNILLLMCDQFRGDCLSFVGHPDVKTPYLDSLAADGICFTNAYSATPSCIPARAALLTGRSQRGHGRVGYEDHVTWDYDHYMAEEFNQADYHTQCIGKMHVHPPRLLCGFQGLKLHDGYLGCYRDQNIPHWMHQEVSDDYLFDLQNTYDRFADFNATGAECNSWVTHPWIYEERLHPTNWVADQSIRYLKTRDHTKPFFLMSSFVRPHQPLDPPQSYYDMYKDKDLRKPVSGDWDDIEKTKQYGLITDSIYGCSDETMRHDAMAGYYGSISHVDHQIGRIITTLREEGVYDDTIIVFVSDHGEMLFDHSLWRKVFPYEGSTHIPFIMHIGKHVADILPHKVNGIAELRDVMPSLLDLCDLTIPESVDGISLKENILTNQQAIRTYLHGEHSFHSSLSNHYIVTETDKYIWYSETGKQQYFDLVKDPTETHNAIHEEAYQQRIAELRQYLIDELKDREEGYSDGTQLIIGKTPQQMIKHPK